MPSLPLLPTLGPLPIHPDPIWIVDVGALAAGEDVYAPLVDAKLATVVGFEPNEAALERRREKCPDHVWVAEVIGDGELHTFHECRYPGCSSLLEPDPEVIAAFSGIATGPAGNFEVVSRMAVETVRLDDAAGIDRCDFLKVDVQGASLMVLENALSLLANTLVVQAEVEFLPVYRDQPLFGEVANFMSAQGFQLHKLVDVSGRPFRPVRFADNPAQPASQLLWADAVFVRDFRRFADLTDVELLRLALILNDVYGSGDLTAYILRILQDRLHLPLTAMYLKTARNSGVFDPSLVSIRDRFDSVG